MKKYIFVLTMTFVVVFFSCGRQEIPPLDTSSCPQISLSSIAGTDTQTVFMNSPITAINYSVILDAAGDSTGFTVSGLPAGVSGYYSGGIFSIEGIPLTTTGSPFTYTVSTLGSACKSVSTVTGRIIVDSCAAITLTSTVHSDSPTVSVNHSLVAITYKITGSAGVSVSSLPAGVTESFSGGILTISGTPTTTAGSPFAYTLIPTSSSCAAPTTGLITVTP